MPETMQPVKLEAGTERAGRLGGGWLAIAHAGWILAVLIGAAIFITGVPLYYRAVQVPCDSARARTGCIPGQLSPGAIETLHRLGVSLGAYAAVALGIVVVSSLVFFAVGALIAWGRWDQGMGLFVSLVLITLGATGISDTLVDGLVTLPLGRLQPVLVGVLAALVSGTVSLQWPAFGALLLTFPTGRFTPRWSWLVILLWVADEVVFQLRAPELASTVTIPITLVATASIQVYRYLRVYGVAQRQQTKWLVLSIAAAIGLAVVVVIAQALAAAAGLPSSPAQATDLVRSVAFFLPVAVAIGIAILRYRLYDIDVIINRALVYGSLTATLAAVYFGVVIGVQSALQALTGQKMDQPVLIVATTLLIAALFNPLRGRLQVTIDRRFYRRKYDAARTVESFGATLRTETDLARLSEQLMTVVQETMQPAHVSLWLHTPRPAEDRQEHQPADGALEVASAPGGGRDAWPRG
jgi:hypothetical protein